MNEVGCAIDRVHDECWLVGERDAILECLFTDKGERGEFLLKSFVDELLDGLVCLGNNICG